ncbi:dephospho-CoA kinase [Candidatus Woesearchaeota archaeon]|nr:dephospho-CoA kinase [Candidatus Woesearchaeota archaeon]
MILAITGNIGSGKTTAARFFAQRGFQIIEADKIGHELYHRNDIKERVIKRFGKTILTRGNVDRKKLKKIVFYDPNELKALNRIMHPAILKEVKKRIQKANVVIEGALLIEAGFKGYDKLLVITIDRKEQMKRVLKRGKYKRKEVETILRGQMPQEEKMKHADIIIDNSGSRKELLNNLRKVLP